VSLPGGTTEVLLRHATTHPSATLTEVASGGCCCCVCVVRDQHGTCHGPPTPTRRSCPRSFHTDCGYGQVRDTLNTTAALQAATACLTGAPRATTGRCARAAACRWPRLSAAACRWPRLDAGYPQTVYKFELYSLHYQKCACADPRACARFGDSRT
jgi:hypothetical protein